MATVEIRRHSLRRKPGQHLSQEGIDLARLAGSAIGPFDLVVTSTLPRAVETAIAMGFEVNDTIAELNSMPEDVFAEFGWPVPLEQAYDTVQAGGVSAGFAFHLGRMIMGVIEQVGESGNILIVSHGGVVELAAMGVLKEAGQALSGEAFGYCEGVRILCNEDTICGEILRVDAPNQCISN